MSAGTTLIDEIVQRVLRELGTAPGAAPLPTTVKPAESSTQRLITFDGQVITREILEKGAGTATHIRLRRGAILTPAARDFLRERRIEIATEALAVAESTRVAGPSCRVLLVRSTPQVVAAVAAARSAGAVDEPRIVGTAAEAAMEGTSILCRGEALHVVVFSDEPELVACLANRNDRIRAAALVSTTGLDRLRASLKPNLFAISAEGRSEFETVRLLKAIHVS